MTRETISILLIEDSDADAFLFRELLDEAGCKHLRVEHVRRLEESLQRLEANVYDAILVDLGLPDSSGLASFRSIHLSHPSLPIVVMSGLNERDIAVQAVREGAQDYLVKGNVDGHGLLRALEYAIERKRVTYEASYLATHDALTGLPNRVFLQQVFAHRLNDARSCKQVLAILLIDLDGFKGVNDTHGHQAGDEVLVGVADRMKHVVRSGDTIARLGGDEFVVVLNGLSTQNEALQVASKLQEAICEPICDDEGIPLHVGASIGVACFPVDGEDVSTLLHAADLAMYDVKKAGGNGVLQHQDLTSPSACDNDSANDLGTRELLVKGAQ